MKLYQESTLSKKLKRRIQELCGFNDLNRADKVSRANEILNSAELKQAICLKILGTTFKDVERAMEAVLSERQLSASQIEELELRDIAPDKFDHEFEFLVNKQAADVKKQSSPYRTYTQEEVTKLLAASNAPCESPAPIEQRSYEYMSRERAEELIREHYAYIENKLQKQEQGLWDSQNTTEFALKTNDTKKPSTSTKT